MPAPETSPLYAMYLQATRKKPVGAVIERKQWVVFPPLPEQLSKTAGYSGVKSEAFLVFSRFQPSLENRVKWKTDWVLPVMIERDLPDKISGLLADNKNFVAGHHWEISPVVTCQVPISELVTLLRDPKTPYKTLERLAKVAKSKHGLAI